MPCVPTAPASRKRNNKQNICNLSFPFERNTTPVKGAQNLVSVYLSSAKTFDTVQKKPCALKYAVSQHKFTNSLQNATKLPTCATQISKVAKGITNAPNLRQTYCNKKTEAKNASVFSVNLFYFTRVNLPMAILFLVVASNKIIPLPTISKATSSFTL